ncbi:PREDICTED: transmembrane protein 41A-like [Amphimedon queenslandica]|uniref:VTT domain-containing protein n=1 Tax=Amphimedon queenslandica TaxID=400682 RepID=A0A1X7UIF5_AMPQE|nr:PREDICTED: transmembrane protein 41A-like [Amphimedon queenslandica]|eukprot:XP_019854109.1 PREDICTED: transmembrane protein 41A-like [Amphimedon queenslandica]
MAVRLVRSVVLVGSVLLLFLFLLYSVAGVLSNRTRNSVSLKFPTSIGDIKDLINDALTLKNDELYLVMVLYSLAYLFKQCFSIPGSSLLNLFAGAVFGLWIGFPLVCVLSASGASLCFLLSKLAGEELVKMCLKERLTSLSTKVKGQSGFGEFLMLLSLRLFPATPNWLLNLSLPHLGVHSGKFFLSVFFGLMPYNFLCVQAGLILRVSTSVDDVMDYKIFAILTISSFSLLAATFGMRKLKKS